MRTWVLVARAGSLLVTLAGLVVLAGDDLPAAVGALRDPQRVVDTRGADVLVLYLAQLALAFLCAWCALCIVMLAATALRPSAALQWVSARLTPTAGRQLLAAALGTGTLVLTACAPSGSSASALPSTTPAYAASSDAFDWGVAAPQVPVGPSSPAAATAPAVEAEPPVDSGVTAGDRAHAVGQHVVAAGECLWTIATAHLGPAASTADIAYFVDQLYDANQHVVGADPDVLPVGVALTVPNP